MYGVRYNNDNLPDFDELDVEFGVKKKEVKEKSLAFSRVGATPLEELGEAELYRVYAGYTQSIGDIVSRFDLAIKSQEYEKQVNENRLKNFKDDITRNFFLVGMVVLFYILIFVMVKNSNITPVNDALGMSKDAAGIQNAINIVVVDVTIPVVLIALLCIFVVPDLLGSIIQYGCYCERPQYMRTINKNKMATYYNQNLYTSQCIIELQKRKKPYVDLLNRIKNGERLMDKEVAFLDDYSNKDLLVPGNPYKFYRLRFRDAWAIMLHKDNWTLTSVKAGDDVARERVPWYKFTFRKSKKFK